ncbi:MAG: SsrA-binding protein SmpB [Candidatus Paceibacterota bacterium]|nr:SsrA-binding protein SmpB [Candidatus Paceibacterota bacterium]
MSNIFATNKKAHFDYEIKETVEAGIVLKGYEVKSIKNSHVSLMGSYATFHNGELFLINTTISEYQAKNQPRDYDKNASHKLLLKKSELEGLFRQIKEKRMVLIPTKIYLKGNKIKVEIGIGRPKKKYDKREVLKERESRREIRRVMQE